MVRAILSSMVVVSLMAHSASAGVQAPTGPEIAALAKRTVFKAPVKPRAGVTVWLRKAGAQSAKGCVAAKLQTSVALGRLAPGTYHLLTNTCAIRTTVAHTFESGGRIVARQQSPVGGSQADFGMCFGWYECRNGHCVCYGLVWQGQEY